MGDRMLVKEKRIQVIFLAFLVIFTHNSFPLISERVSQRTYSYPALSFKLVKNLLSTRLGQIASGIVISISGVALIIYLMKKTIFKNNNYKKKDTKKHDKRCQCQNRKKPLSFEKNYFGKVPDEIETLKEWMRDEVPYASFGIDNMKSLLICGPRGTGKSHLVEVLANEVDAQRFVISGSQLKDLARLDAYLRNIFEQAQRTKKPSVIEIEDFDLIHNKGFRIGCSHRETLFKLQDLMRAFDRCDKKIICIGLINQPKLNDEICRGFNLIHFSLPDKEGREGFLNFCLDEHRKLKAVKETCVFSDDVNFSRIAKETKGFTQGRLKTLINNLFFRVANQVYGRNGGDLEVVGGKIKIRNEEFAKELKKLKEKDEIAKKYFLGSNDSVPDKVPLGMYG